MSALKVCAFVAPGLEPVLEASLRRVLASRALAARAPAAPAPRFVRSAGRLDFQTGQEGLWAIALRCRVCEGLRVEVAQLKARSFKELQKELHSVPWHAWVRKQAVPPVSVSTARKATLYHAGAVEERLAGFFQRRAAPAAPPPSPTGRSAREPPARGPSPPAATVAVRLTPRNAAVVSVDAGGGFFPKRGYRSHVVKLAMRETLAAACAMQLFPGAAAPAAAAPAAAAAAAAAAQRASPPRPLWAVAAGDVRPARPSTLPQRSPLPAAAAALTGTVGGAREPSAPSVSPLPMLPPLVWGACVRSPRPNLAHSCWLMRTPPSLRASSRLPAHPVLAPTPPPM
jgi:hypothetical protein